MKFSNFLSICALYSVLTVCSVCKASVLSSKDLNNLSTNVTSTCGGVINETTGRISYKANEHLLPNERSVWIIRAPEAGEYEVNLESLGVPESLIISAFGYRGHLSTTVVPTTPDDIYIPFVNVLVITLYTGPEVKTDSETGFSLLFVGSLAAGDAISENSTHNIISADFGHLKYPIGRDLYDNFELSTFLVTPVSDSNGNFQKTEVVFALKGMESCTDLLWAYVFNTSLTVPNKWQYSTAICWDVESAVITNQDLILLVFGSDLSTVNTGFHLFTRVNYC